MVGTGSRLFFAYTVLALLGAAVYGLASGGDVVGVLTLGYKGGVGEHFGYAVLVLLGASTLVLGLFSVALRDADPDATAALQSSDVLPEVAPPASASPWPLVGAFGLVVAALGLVVGPGLFVLGLVLLAVTAVEWAVQVWADRATGDPEVNRAIRNRLMAPIEIPVGAVLVILFVVLGISRVLLAVSPLTAVVVASAAASLIMVGAIIVFIRPRHSGTLATAFLLLGALAIIGGGIAGVAAGERDFHEEPAHEAGE
ncbi:MAG TPA: hypothetical protein VIT01_12200 [Acidimicrobiales bacterium]|jgi:hypothetical protein